MIEIEDSEDSSTLLAIATRTVAGKHVLRMMVTGGNDVAAIDLDRQGAEDLAGELIEYLRETCEDVETDT